MPFSRGSHTQGLSPDLQQCKKIFYHLSYQGSQLKKTEAARRWSSERLRGDTPHPRSGAVAVRSYPTSKVRSGGCEEIPHIQGQEQWL